MKIDVIALLTLILAVVCSSNAEERALPAPKVKRVGVEEFDKLCASTNTILIDVRSTSEFEKGHIPAAINIDINSSQFTEKADALDKGKVYLINCAVGMRSARACKKLEGMGFTNLFDLAPGFDGWKKAGKPVQK